MLVFLIRRLLQSVVVLFAMSAIVFVGVYAIGDPVEILVSPDATPAERAAIAADLGLDRSLWHQYVAFLGNALQGDLGNSFVFNVPAVELILQRMPATLELAIAALLIATIIGIPLGLWAGLRPDAPSARLIMVGSILGFSLPTFWVGLMLIIVFAVELGWLPATGRGDVATFLGIRSSMFTLDGWSHLILPAVNLALFNLALVIRMTRASVREILPLDYVRFARSKGLGEPRVVTVHVLKNTMIPLITVLGLEFGTLIAFAVVTETIFAWPGMGKLVIDSINQLDRPVVVAYLLITVTIVIAINLVVDILYAVFDPRVKLGDRRG